MKHLYLIVLIAFLGLSSKAQERPIGMNLSFHTYWSPQMIFGNQMKQASNFKVREVWGGTFELPNSFEQYPKRADGYPTQVPFTFNGLPCKVHVILMGGHRQPYPAGTYNLTFEGTGRVSVEWDTPSAEFTTPNVLHPIQVTPQMGMYGSNGIHVTIEESDPNDPVHNIQVLAPGAELTYQTHPFNPRALELLKGMKCIRAMHALYTNREDTNLVTSNMQTPYDYYTQSAQWYTGLHHNYLIELGKQLKADVWMNFPFNVSDTLIRNVALDFKANLAPGQKVYIEYGNELWNFAYPYNIGTSWVQDRGYALNFDTSASYAAGRRYVAYRSAQMFRIWQDAFDGDTSRFVRVLASHGANPWTGLVELYAINNTTINPTGTRADALAIAPYFGGGVGDYLHSNNMVASTPEDTILNYLSREIDTDRRTELVDNKENTDNFGVRLICYEAGQHLTTSFQDDTALVDLLAACNRNPKMKDLYCQYYDMWYEIANDIMLTFNFVDSYSKFGAFGNLESMGQDTATAPKWKALNECVFSYNGVGVDENPAQVNNAIYPNPGASELYFKEPVSGAIKVYTAMGQLVYSAGSADKFVNKIDLSELGSGIYIIQGSFGSLKWSKL